MQVEELFEFVYVLIDKRQVTAREMAERFGVSVRTVYRWVEALSVAGIPVYSMKGRGGGIAISEGYSFDKRILSEEEKLAIVSSVKAMSSLDGSQMADIELQLTRAGDDQKLRAMFYGCKLFVGTLKEGELYKAAPSVYQIFLTDYDPFGDGRFFHRALMRTDDGKMF